MCTFGLLVTGIPIGAGDCLVMIACCILFIFKCEYSGFGSPLNYKGPTADASGKAGFSGKIPERSEDDFFRNRLRPDLAVRQEAFANFAL